MSRTAFLLLMIAIVAVVFVGMWLAWRARARRDADVVGAATAPSGELLGSFAPKYVATTPEGEPLVRVSAPGLRYRGPAEVAVRRDGVTVTVAGEQPVHISAAQLRGGGSARVRIDRVVEHDGLALLKWESAGRSLESSFRFTLPEEQRAFADALDTVASAAATQTISDTTQEDA